MIRRTRLGRGVLLVAVVCSFAAACGSGSGDTGGGQPAASVADGNDEACARTTSPEPPPGDAEPERGGTLVYGLEAETDGWDPTISRWASSGLEVAGTLFDTWTRSDINGEAQPYLAESLTADTTYQTWTLKLRPDVTFHNGETLDAATAVANLEAYRQSILTSPTVAEIVDVSVVDPLTVEVNLAHAWPQFPELLTTQVGTVVAPEMLQDPERARHPVGTGPFQFEEWTPDAELVVVRNPNYWQEGLPYLDRIVFKPLPDSTARLSALSTGDIDMLQSSSASALAPLRADAASNEIQLWESCRWGEDEEFLVLLNNEVAPFNDLRMRNAFALAIDQATLAETAFRGEFAPADGPFAPGSPWYIAPEAGKEQDVNEASRLVAEYTAELGAPTVELGAPAGLAEASTTMQYIGSQLEAVGVQVGYSQLEQTAYIVDALTGNYQALFWRQFGFEDPDQEYIWWHPSNAKPVGQLALNGARITDESMGDALDQGRQSDDLAERRAAYAIVQERFRDQQYLYWIAHAHWAIAAQTNVHGVEPWMTPDGAVGMPITNGTHPLAALWVDR